MKTIKIFLASSEELKQERLELTEMVAHLNHTLKNRDLTVELVKWEHLDSSMGPLHKQEEYNNELQDCNLCLVLFWTRFGLYTKTELDVAYRELCAGRNPQKIYVYFKNAAEISPELQQFRDDFPHHYGHFFCNFENIDTLKADFLLQFLDYLSNIQNGKNLVEIRNSQVIVGDKVYVDMTKVPFAGNNDEYNLLLKSIKKTRKLLAVTDTDDPEYSEYAQELQELLKKQQAMEDSLWDTALMITKLGTEKCSERLNRAIELFNQGNNKGANAILNEQDIERDIRHNLNLIELGKEGQKGLKDNIEEYELKVKTIKAEMSEGWGEKMCHLHERIIELYEALYGKDSLEVADALADAGSAYLLLRLDQVNLKANLRALEIRKKLLGEQHPDTAESYNDIGLAYDCLGIHKKALEYHQKALKINTITLGETHPSTAAAYNNVGCDFCSLGNYRKALEYQLKSIEIKVSTIGENHPDTAMSYDNVGFTFCQLGEFDKALEYHLKALSIMRSHFGETHPDTSIAYDNVGFTYSQLGNYKKALEYQLKSIEIKVLLFGENHPNTAIAYNNAGTSFSNKGNYEDALEYQSKGLKIKESTIGENHPSTATSYHDLGLTYDQLGDKEKAYELQSRALDIYRLTLGENHPFTATCYNNLAITATKLQKYQEALEYRTKALEIRLSTLGENHPDTATSYNNLGSTYEDLGDYPRALVNKLKALEIRERISGVSDIDTASSYYDLGDFYSGPGKDYEQSITYFNKALESGCLHPTYKALANKFIGICYRELGDYGKALEYAQKALGFSIQEYGKDQLEVARCHNSVALACRKLNRIDEALQHFRAALEIRKQLLPSDDEDIKKSENYIQETQQQFENNNY